MRILICGDVVGKAGRKVLEERLPEVRERLDVDFVVVNGENAAHGYGITQKICEQFYELGVDAVTTGNHVWDQREIIQTIGDDPRFLRPMNYPEGTPGTGSAIFAARGGQRVMIMHPMGRLFMDPLDDPFQAVDAALANNRLGRSRSGNVDAVIVDFHAEATSEKQAMGHYLDGRVSVVVGTHTHVPTGDARVLPGGTAFMTDLGMCGDYDSVIGMNKKDSMERFTRKMPLGRLEPAEGEATLCAAFVETDDHTGLARRIAAVRVGGGLPACWPN